MQKWDKTRTAISCIGVVTARGGKKRKILKNVTINDTKPPHAAEVEKNEIPKWRSGAKAPPGGRLGKWKKIHILWSVQTKKIHANRSDIKNEKMDVDSVFKMLIKWRLIMFLKTLIKTSNP